MATFDLHAAVAAARAGATIALPAGTIRLPRTLVLARPVTLVGRGAATRIVGGANGVIVAVRAAVTLRALAIARTSGRGDVVAVSSGHLTAEGLVACGGKERRDGELGAGVRVQRTARATLVRCTLERNHDGFFAEGKARVDLSALTATKNRNTGLAFAGDVAGTVADTTAEANLVGLWCGERTKMVMRACRSTRSRWHGVFIGGRATPRLEAVEIRGSGRMGIYVYDRAAPVLERCRVMGSGFQGIRFEGKTGGAVRGSTSSDNKLCGIYVDEGATPLLADNAVEQNRENGIQVSGTAEVQAVGNRCTKNRGAGIIAFERAGLVARDNTCEANEDGGLVAHGEARATLERNTATGNRYDGITMFGDARFVLDGNVCRRNRRSGIEIREHAGGTLRGNHCLANREHGIALLAADVELVLERNVGRGNGDGDYYRDSDVDTDELELRDNELERIDEPRYTVRLAPPRGHRIPPLLAKFGRWLAGQGYGAVGYFELLVERVSDERDRAGRLGRDAFSFVHLGEGSRLLLIATEPRSPRAVVLLGSEGATDVVADSLEQFLVNLGAGETGISDLDIAYAPCRPALQRWLRAQRVVPPKVKARFDFDAYLDAEQPRSAPASRAVRSAVVRGLPSTVKTLAGLVGRRADDPAVVAFVKKLGKQVPTSTTNEMKHVVANRHGLELGFKHEVKNPRYPAIAKTASSYVPYLTTVWLRRAVAGGLPFGLRFGMSQAELGKTLGRPAFRNKHSCRWERPLDPARDVVLHVFPNDWVTIVIGEDKS